MSRLQTHTIEDAPPASRDLLEQVLKFSPTGKPLNLHAQMAHAPSVLAGYSGMRRANSELGTIPQPVVAAVMLATAGAIGNAYAIAITAQLAAMGGWTPNQIEAIRLGQLVDDSAVDALLAMAREVARNAGKVDDDVWAQASKAGWSSEQLAEIYGPIALTVFTAHFLNFAQTELDVPVPAPAQ